MIIRFAEEKDIEQINKLLVQVNSIHHRGRPDLFKSGKKKYIRLRYPGFGSGR